MPSTTNFGWTTPADTDLVKDGAAAIRTLGNGVDASFVDLKGGTTGQVLSKNSNTDLDFVWVTSDDANAIQNTIVDAKADLITATAADTPARLAVGTNGQVLTADSSTSTGLKWATPAGGGKLLQVVNATTATSVTTSSNSNSDTNLTATITPSSTSSKILVTIHQNGIYKTNGSADNCVSIFLLRGSTSITSVDFAGLVTGTAITAGYGSFSMSYLDSPNTTSATTYKTQFRSRANTTSVSVNYPDSTSYITLMEIGA